MNLKLSALILFIGSALGLAGGYKLFKNDTQPQQPTVVTKTQVKRVIVREKDGTEKITETVTDSSDSSAPPLPVKSHTLGLLPKYDFIREKPGLGAFYTYKNIGGYIAGDSTGLKEVGLALTYSF